LDQEFLLVEEVIIGLLLIASLVAVAANRYRLPYTVGLVLIGLALTVVPELPIRLTSDIILAVLVPPLLFEAAFHLNLEDLKRDLGFILLLAVPGVIITTLVVGGIIRWGTGMETRYAMIFGALIAATDPVAVVALFRRLGVPKRLQVLLEGESLFNDGTAVVIFVLMLALAPGVNQDIFSILDVSGNNAIDVVDVIATFLMVAGGGVLVGIVLGMAISQLIGRIDNPLAETTLTTVLAFGSYLVAETLGVSGVLAVVAAGILNGNVGPRGMSATTRVVVFNFWEYAAFLMNSMIFLLIGLSVQINELFKYRWEIAVAILAVLVARLVSIYGFSLFASTIPGKWRHILYWGGLRGAIALALVLILPETGLLPGIISQIKAMAFGVVLFTLIVQGFSMAPLVKRLKIIQRSHFQEEYERRHARFVASRSAHDYLRRMSQQGLISEHTWQRLSSLMERQSETLVDAVREVVTSDPTVETEELDTARREALRAQRSALTGLLRDGIISEETYTQLVSEVDFALTEPNLTWPELLRNGAAPALEVRRLMAVVIQETDVENAISAMNKVGFTVSRMQSSGGFLRRRNVTLLIGLPEGREESAVKVLRSSCRQRVEFASSLWRDLPMLSPTRVTVGGAAIFVFEVEFYEEF